MKILANALAAMLAISVVGTAATSASAMPQRTTNIAMPETAIQKVGHRHRRSHDRRGFYHSGDRPYYNGYRGYRHRRSGYRRHNGYWFPRSAFSFGIIISPRPRYAEPRYRRGSVRLSSSHYRWCDAKYRSYRSYDNSFQPYNGSRRQCVSPYY